MSTQQIVERILSDATAEADAVVAAAEAKAAKILAEATARAEKNSSDAEIEIKQKRKNIFEKREADARLECSKILLKEKRKVVDAVYDEALSRLLELSKEDCLHLTESLLKAYAEKGDELFFAANFPYKADVEILPVIKEKEIKIAAETLPLDGGMRLKGVTSDKDLSFGALLAADREEYQSELAKNLFQ